MLFPGCPAGAVHRDYPYWSRPLKALGLHLRDLPISRILELQMIVALDEFTAQNGATGLIPGKILMEQLFFFFKHLWYNVKNWYNIKQYTLLFFIHNFSNFSKLTNNELNNKNF